MAAELAGGARIALVPREWVVHIQQPIKKNCCATDRQLTLSKNLEEFWVPGKELLRFKPVKNYLRTYLRFQLPQQTSNRRNTGHMATSGHNFKMLVAGWKGIEQLLTENEGNYRILLTVQCQQGRMDRRGKIKAVVVIEQ